MIGDLLDPLEDGVAFVGMWMWMCGSFDPGGLAQLTVVLSVDSRGRGECEMVFRSRSIVISPSLSPLTPWTIIIFHHSSSLQLVLHSCRSKLYPKDIPNRKTTNDHKTTPDSFPLSSLLASRIRTASGS